MKCNVGKSDRLLRIAAGLLVLGAGLYFQNWAGLLGLIPLATGVFRFCPAYIPFKIDTNTVK